MTLEVKTAFSTNQDMFVKGFLPLYKYVELSFYLSNKRKYLFHTKDTIVDESGFVLNSTLLGITSTAKMKELFLYCPTIVKVLGAKPKTDKNRIFYVGKGFLADPTGVLIVSFQDGPGVKGITMYVSNRLMEYPAFYKWITDLYRDFDGQIILKKSINELINPKIEYPMGQTVAETKQLKAQFLNHAIKEYKEKFVTK